MAKKSIQIIGLFLLIFGNPSEGYLFAQFPCGTTPNPEQIKALTKFYREAEIKNKPWDDTIAVPVKIHIIRKSDGTGGLSLQKFQAELDSVNYFYLRSGIQFELCGQVNYINQSEYKTLNMPEEEDLLVQSTESPRSVNIYFADTLLLNGKRICGYSYLPMGPNCIFIDNTCVNSGNTLAHELGHYFSLLHTHGQSNSTLTDELVNGSNCSVAGDYICDTPADPNLDGRVSYNALTKKCTYTGNAKDANGQAFTPMVENIMSYSKPQCTDSFTQGQFRQIRNSLFYHGRIDLICTDENASVTGDRITGVYPIPFNEYFFVYYQLQAEARITLVLYDLVGKQVSVLYDNTEPRGNLKLFYPWTDTFLNSGIYFLKMEVNGKLADVRKIIRISF